MEGFTKSNLIVKHLLERLGITPENERVYFFWENVLGEKLVKKIPIVGIKNDHILVTISSPAHHHQLKISQKEWLKKLNSFVGKERFKFIKIVKL